MSIRGNYYGFLGYMSHQRSLNAQAESYYARGIACGGMKPQYEGAYGVLLLRRGMFQEALERFDNALKDSSCKGNLRNLIRMNRAIAWYKLGDTARAIVALEDLHRHFRTLRVYQTLGYFYTAAGMFDKAEPFNMEAVEYDSEDSVILDNTAQMYIEMGNYEAAREYADKAYSKRRFSDALYHKGLLAEHDESPAEALDFYREALTMTIDALNDVTKEKLHTRIAAIKEKYGITEDEQAREEDDEE